MEKSSFTENKDINKEILLKFDDRDFIISCNLNTYFQKICKENDYLLYKKRLQIYYPDTLKIKENNKLNWKEYYLKVVKTVALLEEKFRVKYISGNPFRQLEILFESFTDTSPLGKTELNKRLRKLGGFTS